MTLYELLALVASVHIEVAALRELRWLDAWGIN
jgi:hypothetical protein